MPRIAIEGGGHGEPDYYIEADPKNFREWSSVVDVTDAELADYLEVERQYQEKQKWLEQLDKRAERFGGPLPPAEPAPPPPWAKHFTITKKDISSPIAEQFNRIKGDLEQKAALEVAETHFTSSPLPAQPAS